MRGSRPATRGVILALLTWACATTDKDLPPAEDTDPPDTDVAETDPVGGDDTDAADTDPAGGDDTDPADTDTDEVDTAPADTDTGAVAVPRAGFGTIAGACGELDGTEWGSADPFLFRSDLDFGAAAFSAGLLSPGGQQILAEGTLGGSSGESEAVSFDLLWRCELADLLKSESRILYLDAGGKKTDILVEIDGRKVGVSVTRAMTFAWPEPCAPTDVAALTELIERKVGDLPLSMANADPVDRWERSMLYVVACDDAHADQVETLFWGLDPAVRGDAILMVTATAGDDAFIY